VHIGQKNNSESNNVWDKGKRFKKDGAHLSWFIFFVTMQPDRLILLLGIPSEIKGSYHGDRLIINIMVIG
jgi:hypothetical protein